MPALPLSRRQLAARVRAEGPQVLRIVVVAALSWQLCIWLGAREPPVFAVVVPVVALRDHPYSAFNLSFDRMIGVVCGVALAALVVRWLGVSVLSMTLVLSVGLAAGVVLRVGTSLNVQIAVSGLLVFASADPASYGVSRIWETAVGAVVCIVLSPLLFPPNARKAFETELSSVETALSDQLFALQRLLRGATDTAALTELSVRTGATEDAARALAGSHSAALRAVEHNPLRRADTPRLSAREPEVRLAIELARVERLLLDEIVDLSTRPDLHQLWPHLQAPLLRVVEPTAEAVRLWLRESGQGQQVAALHAAGDAQIEQWKAADSQPIAAVMRRPLRRLLDLLAPSADDHA